MSSTIHNEFTGPEPEEEKEDLFEHYRITADKGQEALRIDKFLMDRIPNTSRTKIQAAALNGNILVNGNTVKSNYKIKPQDKISIVLPYPIREIELIPQDIPIDIVYEDDDVAVINKQAGIVVHPGYGNYSGTLVNALIFHFEKIGGVKNGGGLRPGLVHRLDKLTTGLMVIAKNDFSLAHLAKQFYDRTTERAYVAIVWGDLPDQGLIEGNIGRSVRDRKRMAVFPEGDMGKEARTHFKVLKRFGYVTVVECKLETGRTHQIRVHLSHMKRPLFNDAEYGGDKIIKGTTFSKYKQFIENCFKILPRQALHAKTLGFEHPVTGEKMSFDSKIPDDMQQIIDRWEAYTSNQK